MLFVNNLAQNGNEVRGVWELETACASDRFVRCKAFSSFAKAQKQKWLPSAVDGSKVCGMPAP